MLQEGKLHGQVEGKQQQQTRMGFRRASVV